MNKVARAIIKWVSPEQGGRQIPPLVGSTYSTVARFEDDPDWPNQAWSLVVELKHFFRDGRSAWAMIQFLADDAPVHLLEPGSRFALFEGKKRVAKGIVLPSTLARPEEISDFESILVG